MLRDRPEKPISTETAERYFNEFDPTLYGMPALLDDQGNYVYPEGFDSEAGERLEGYEQERDEWEEQYAAARSRFDAHRRLFGISGYDLTITIPVTFTELILGAKIRIWPLRRPRPITVKLTPCTPNGRTLRVSGLGAPRPNGADPGDLLITLDARIPEPETLNADVLNLMERLHAAYNGDHIRAELFNLPDDSRKQPVNPLPERSQERATERETVRTEGLKTPRILADAERIAQAIRDDPLKARVLARVAGAMAAIDPDRAARLITDAERIAGSITNLSSKARAQADVAGAMAAINPTAPPASSPTPSVSQGRSPTCPRRHGPRPTSRGQWRRSTPTAPPASSPTPSVSQGRSPTCP